MGPWEGFKDVAKVNGNFAEEEMREAVWSNVRGGEGRPDRVRVCWSSLRSLDYLWASHIHE